MDTVLKQKAVDALEHTLRELERLGYGGADVGNYGDAAYVLEQLKAAGWNGRS